MNRELRLCEEKLENLSSRAALFVSGKLLTFSSSSQPSFRIVRVSHINDECWVHSLTTRLTSSSEIIHSHSISRTRKSHLWLLWPSCEIALVGVVDASMKSKSHSTKTFLLSALIIMKFRFSVIIDEMRSSSFSPVELLFLSYHIIFDTKSRLCSWKRSSSRFGENFPN